MLGIHWKTYIGTCSQHEESDQNDDYVHRQAGNSTDTSSCDPTIAVVCLSHPDVGSAPEDEAEERVEERAHQR